MSNNPNLKYYKNLNVLIGILFGILIGCLIILIQSFLIVSIANLAFHINWDIWLVFKISLIINLFISAIKFLF